MSDPEQRAADRLDRVVGRLLRGKRAGARASDAADHDVITTAARLVGARESRPRMSPDFRRKLARRLREEPSAPGGLSRRMALTGGAGLALGALGGGLAGVAYSTLTDTTPNPAPSGSPPNPRSSREKIVPKTQFGRWVDTGLTLDALGEGVPHRVSAGSVGAFVVRRGGEVQVMSAYCTHVACELQWRQQAGDLLCPCHGRSFTLDGLSVDDHDYPLPALPLVQWRVRNGRIEVYGT